MLCILANMKPWRWEPTLIRISGDDPKFSQNDIAYEEIESLGSYHFMGSRVAQLQGDEPAAVVTLVMKHYEQYQSDGYHLVRLTVTTTGVSCSEAVLTDDPCIDLAISGRGGWFVHLTHRSDIIYCDNGVAPMAWMKRGKREYGHGEMRWFASLTDDKVLIFDSAERSEVATAEFCPEQSNGRLPLPPTVKVSNQGVGIVAAEGGIYRFSALTFVQPLESLAAIATWNQLSGRQRKAVGDKGLWEFSTLLQACSPVKRRLFNSEMM